MILQHFFPNMLVKRKGFRPRFFSSPFMGNAGISCHLLCLEASTRAHWFYTWNIHMERRKTIPTNAKIFLGKFPSFPICPNFVFLPAGKIYHNIDCPVRVHQSSVTFRMKRTFFRPFTPWATGMLLVPLRGWASGPSWPVTGFLSPWGRAAAKQKSCAPAWGMVCAQVPPAREEQGVLLLVWYLGL